LISWRFSLISISVFRKKSSPGTRIFVNGEFY
jgi:hypothetical protein